MRFVVGVVAGFVIANLESISGIADKIADGLEVLADKLHSVADKENEE